MSKTTWNDDDGYRIHLANSKNLLNKYWLSSKSQVPTEGDYELNDIADLLLKKEHRRCVKN